MPDQTYWDNVLQNIADIRVWLSEVERNIPTRVLVETPVSPPPTMSVDDEVAAADSVTRVHKALEREFHIDRRTVYQRVERLVLAMQMDRATPDWRTNVGFHKRLAERDASGKTRLQRGLEYLDAKRVAA